MATEAPPVPERRVSLWKRSLVALGLFLVVSFLTLLLVGARTSYSGRSSLIEVIAETDRLDPRWRWEQIDEDRPEMPNVGNSVMISNAVHKSQLSWERHDLHTADGRAVPGDGPPNQRLDAERLALLRKAVVKQQGAIALALTLKDYPRGRAPLSLTPDVIGTLLPYAQNSRAAYSLLQLECEQLLHDGRGDMVPDRVRAMLHGGAGLRDEPLLISQLVRFAGRPVAARQIERALGLGALSDEDCRKLAAHIAAERTENLLLAGMRGERASMHVLFENLESGRVSLADMYGLLEGRAGGLGPGMIARGGAMLYGPRVYEDHANFLRWANRACVIAAMPAHEQGPEWATFETEFKAFVSDSRRTLHNLITMMIMPAIAKVAEAGQRDNALLGCVQTALAAERFRLANTRWPKSLDELPPKYLPAVPLDAFTGKPLLLAVMDDGIAIYSTGKDGKDDDGKVLDKSAKAGADFGVRLWNADRRGVEPPKAPPPE